MRSKKRGLSAAETVEQLKGMKPILQFGFYVSLQTTVTANHSISVRGLPEIRLEALLNNQPNERTRFKNPASTPHCSLWKLQSAETRDRGAPGRQSKA